jgi:hypothetical protein
MFLAKMSSAWAKAHPTWLHILVGWPLFISADRSDYSVKAGVGK